MTLKSLIAEICTPDEAAETLGVTSRRVVALINAGQLPAEQFGGTWAILRSDLPALSAMIETKGGLPSGRPRLPLKIFGDYRIAEYAEGTLLGSNDGLYWFGGLNAIDALLAFYQEDRDFKFTRQMLADELEDEAKDPEWVALLKYANVCSL
jgi:excisionase family DNA binding protein